MSDKDPNSDLEGGFDDGDGGFDDFGVQNNTLAELWKNNPMVKIGAIFGVLALIVVALIIFGGKPKKPPVSVMGTGSDVSEVPGEAVASPDYRSRIEEVNIDRAEEAQRTGGSAMPIPLEPPNSSLLPPDEEASPEDPLERWRRLQESRKSQVAEPEQQPSGPPPPDTRGQAVDALAKLMATQMSSALSAQKGTQVAMATITQPEWLTALTEQDQAGGDTAYNEGSDNGKDSDTRAAAAEILIPAGQIVYAQTLIEANTDAPGPVLAQIAAGPYAGSRIIGDFEATDDYLILNFHTLVIDGVGHPVSAVALDPDTSLPGLASEVDRRYLKRIVLPMASAFVSGLAGAISDSGTTTITINDSSSSTTQTTGAKDQKQEVASGISEAGDKLGQIIDDEASKTKTLIRLKAGTPLGILFIEPVTKQE